MQKPNSIIIAIILLLVAIFIAKDTYAENVNVPSSKQVELANESAKGYFEIRDP